MVPNKYRKDILNKKYTMSFKFFGTVGDEPMELTYSRCNTCKSRMKGKCNEEAESDRFCDILSNVFVHTRRVEGNQLLP